MTQPDDKTAMENNVEEASTGDVKKRYDTPRVSVLGTLLEITRGGETGTPDGANAGSFGEI